MNAIGIRDPDVFVTVARPPLATPGRPGAWTFQYPSTVLRVARDRLLADGPAGGLASAVPATGDVPRTGHRGWWTWLEDDPDRVLRHGVRAGGLVWWVGAPHGGDKINRSVVAVGHDPETGGPRVRVDLGLGLVGDAQAIGAELWLTVARRRHLAVPHDRGVDVLAVSAAGSVRTVHSAASVDISRFAPPLRRPAETDIRHHIDTVRNMFAGLASFWSDSDGTSSPLSRGLTDTSVSVEGQWPEACVVMRMRYRRRPGLVLRRTLPLFDEAGWPIDHQYADIHLTEDLETDYLAPADEAVDGVLDT